MERTANEYLHILFAKAQDMVLHVVLVLVDPMVVEEDLLNSPAAVPVKEMLMAIHTFPFILEVVVDNAAIAKVHQVGLPSD